MFMHTCKHVHITILIFDPIVKNLNNIEKMKVPSLLSKDNHSK